MRRMRKEIHAAQARECVRLGQAAGISRQGRWIARDIEDAICSEVEKTGQNVWRQSVAWRICQDV